MTSRPAIPTALRREVLVEAGHRCAIPTCRATTTEIAHIVPWAETRDHTFENLIALCPNCHTRYDRQDIDRQSMLMYKRNLGLVSGRYGEAERRLLDMLAKTPNARQFIADRPMDFEFMYLIEDGLLSKPAQKPIMLFTLGGATYPTGPTAYWLTDDGLRFVERLRAGQDADQPE